MVSEDGEILACNPAAEQLWDRSRADLEGARLRDLVLDPPSEVRDYLRSAAHSTEVVAAALTVRGDADVTCACLAGRLAPVQDGETAQLMLRLRDQASDTDRFRLMDDQIDRLTREIRRRQRAEWEVGALLENLEFSRGLLEESQRSARVGSWEWDLETGALTWSEEMYRIYGLDPEADEIDYERYRSLIHPEERGIGRAKVEASLESYEPFSYDHRIIRPDGTVRTVHARGRVVRGPDGKPLRMIGSGQDVTERKRQEDRSRFLADTGHILASSLDYEETLRQVAETAVPDMADQVAVDVVEGDRVRRLTVGRSDSEPGPSTAEVETSWHWVREASQGVARVIGSGEPLLLRSIPDAFLDQVAHSEEEASGMRDLGLRSALVVPMLARDRVLGAISFLMARSGRSYGEDDLALGQELAKRAAIAIDNARLYREAQDASRSRDELMAMVSHDLRSPLAAIITGAGLVLDERLSKEKREKQIRNLLSAARRIERLTDDLLDLARIDAGQLPMDPAPHDPGELIRTALADSELAANEAGVELVGDVETELPRIRADRGRLRQAFDNLVKNAIRHTPAGGRVTVGAECSPGEVRFRVADTGSGIPEELRDQVFDRFRQDGGESCGAAGLGLPITRGIVEAHGGRIWLDSQVGPGSTFRFTVPTVSTASSSTPPSSTPASSTATSGTSSP